VKNKVLLVSLVVIVSMLMVSKGPLSPGLSVFVTLANGQTATGILPGQSLEFDGVSASGEAVKVKVQPPPSWSALDVACEIDWNPERKLYIIRGFDWTGELMRIWEQLRLQGVDGKTVILFGKDVKQARFIYTNSTKQGNRE
jgi:hypothetical protein